MLIHDPCHVKLELTSTPSVNQPKRMEDEIHLVDKREMNWGARAPRD